MRRQVLQGNLETKSFASVHGTAPVNAELNSIYLYLPVHFPGAVPKGKKGCSEFGRVFCRFGQLFTT